MLRTRTNTFTDAATSTTGARGLWYEGDEDKQAQMFMAKAAGYGSFMILLYFLLAATLCLCTMRNRKVGD